MCRHPFHALSPRLRAAGLACALVVAFGACKRVTPRDESRKAVDAETAAAVPNPQELAAVLEKALNAYNASDQAALFADFASTATPAPSDRIFAELFEGYYKTEFGKILALRLDQQESVPAADFGMLVYLAQCERQPLARVSANFVRENGTPKIVQLRIEKVEGAAD